MKPVVCFTSLWSLFSTFASLKLLKTMTILGRALLLRPSLGISSNRRSAFFTTRAAIQSIVNGRVSVVGFRGGRFIGAVSIPRLPAVVLHNTRSFAATPTTSGKWCNRPNSFTGCDIKEWRVDMEPPEGNPKRDEIIDSYIKTLTKIVGSEEEARMKIYFVSTKHYFAFGCQISEELSYKLSSMEMVRYVGPEFSKTYGAEPFINGQAVPYDPKYHEDWLENNAPRPSIEELREEREARENYYIKRGQYW